MVSTQSQSQTIEEKLNEWIDPVTETPAGITYCLYKTPSRGINTKGSYLIFFPPDYEKDKTKKFPVMYWLHGGNGTAREGIWAIKNYEKGMKLGLMTQTVIVSVQALPVGRYVDSIDGKQSIEQVIIKDLVPHIDNSYRTIVDSKFRCLEGISMGGYGALRFGFKYSDIFGLVSAIAPSILRNLSEEPEEVSVAFGNSQKYFEEVGPWNLAEINSERFIQNKNKLRLFIGKNDFRLLETIRKYHIFLKHLYIPHIYEELPDAGHVYEEVVLKYGNDFFSFWKTV